MPHLACTYSRNHNCRSDTAQRHTSYTLQRKQHYLSDQDRNSAHSQHTCTDHRCADVNKPPVAQTAANQSQVLPHASNSSAIAAEAPRAVHAPPSARWCAHPPHPPKVSHWHALRHATTPTPSPAFSSAAHGLSTNRQALDVPSTITENVHPNHA